MKAHSDFDELAQRFIVSLYIKKRNFLTFITTTRASVLAIAATIAMSPMAAHADAPQVQVISYSQLVNEIKENKVQELTFAPNEKSVFLKTSDGLTQQAVVLPSSQVRSFIARHCFLFYLDQHPSLTSNLVSFRQR
jgi:ATP-dependent Zn protease